MKYHNLINIFLVILALGSTALFLYSKNNITAYTALGFADPAGLTMSYSIFILFILLVIYQRLFSKYL